MTTTTKTNLESRVREHAAREIDRYRRSVDTLAERVALLAAGEVDPASVAELADKICGVKRAADLWTIVEGFESETFEEDLAGLVDHHTRRIATDGADDRSSGRGNDRQRIVFDATRAWLLDAGTFVR